MTEVKDIICAWPLLICTIEHRPDHVLIKAIDKAGQRLNFQDALLARGRRLVNFEKVF